MTSTDWQTWFVLKIEEADRGIANELATGNDSRTLFGLRQKRSAFAEGLRQAQKDVW